MYKRQEYGLEQVYNVIDSRYRSRKPLIVTTNLSLTELQNPQDTAHARICLLYTSCNLSKKKQVGGFHWEQALCMVR